MPGLGGMEVLKALRQERPETYVVIIFTGYANVETAREALKNGAFDYVPKPFTPDELRSVVANALEARKNAAGAKMLDLMAIVSHELKSPLATVQTTAATLHRGYFGKLEPEQQKIVETIIRNCEYLEDIIRSYIDLSKMELDGLDAFKERIPFVSGDRQAEALDMPESAGQRPADAHRRRRSRATRSSRATRELLKIVVGNLVNNAIKYGRRRARRSGSGSRRQGERGRPLRPQRGRRHLTGGHPRPALQAVRAPETEGHRGRQGLGAGPLHLQDHRRQAQRPYLGRVRAGPLGRVLRGPAHLGTQYQFPYSQGKLKKKRNGYRAPF